MSQAEFLWALPTVLPLYRSTDLATRWDCNGWRRDLEQFMRERTLADVLRPLLEDGELARTVAANSYPHVTGFDKLVLLKDSNGSLIKLDVWWPGHRERSLTDNIHSHQWSFSSIVVSGSLQMQHFVPAAEGIRARIYRLSYPPGTYAAEERDRHLLPVWAAKLEPGSSYDLDLRVLHLSRSDEDEPTVTLVVQSRPLREFSETALYRDLPEPDQDDTAWQGVERAERLGEQMVAFETDALLEKVERLCDLPALREPRAFNR